MWVVFLLGIILPFNFNLLGIYPRSFRGLPGIIFAPLIHGNFIHIFSNTFPMLFLGLILFMFYDRIAEKVFFQGYLYTNILVWVFARPAYHIGASGLIYCLASFLIFFGLFRNDLKSIIISIFIILLYGGLVYGIMPVQPGVSWESHLMGGISGLILAFYYKDTGPLRKLPDWMYEEDDEEDDEFYITGDGDEKLNS